MSKKAQGKTSKGKGREQPFLERVAEMAMRAGRRHLADYGAARSRHDFTQNQLMACLVLRVFLKSTYRGVVEALEVSAALRERLGLCGKLPHYTTLQKFSTSSRVAEIAAAMTTGIGRRLAAHAAGGGQPARLCAGSGYDAEWLHAHCREQWEVPAVIPPVQRRAEHLRQNHYTSRWAVESYFSAHKRTVGSTLAARRPDQMLAKASLKVLAYAIRR